MDCGRFCLVPFSPQRLKLSQGLCSTQDGGGSFLLLALGGGLTLQNDPGWVQGFASSGAVGGDVTGNLI